jgi:hypothetical protein
MELPEGAGRDSPRPQASRLPAIQDAQQAEAFRLRWAGIVLPQGADAREYEQSDVYLQIDAATRTSKAFMAQAEVGELACCTAQMRARRAHRCSRHFASDGKLVYNVRLCCSARALGLHAVFGSCGRPIQFK